MNSRPPKKPSPGAGMPGSEPPPGDAPELPAPDVDGWTDLSLGSRQFGIRPAVLIESSILQDYREVEPALGLNTAGVILSVLSSRLAGNPEDSVITVCLLHRGNRRPVELELEIQQKQLAHHRRVALLRTRRGAERQG